MILDIFVIDADYVVREGKPFVRLYGRTHEGKSAIVLDSSFYPYFYVVPRSGLTTEDLLLLKSRIEKIIVKGNAGKASDETANGGDETAISGGEIAVKSVEISEKTVGLNIRHILKVFANIPAHIPHLKSNVKTNPAVSKKISDAREYDIPFYKRYFLDKKIAPLTWVCAEGTEISQK